MPTVRRPLLMTTCLVLATACGLPAAAMAQSAAPAPQAAPDQQTASDQQAAPTPPLTQDVKVNDPDMAELKPGTPSSSVKPRWSEFPKAPKNVPTVFDFAARVHKAEADSAALDAISRSIIWEMFAPDAIAASANAQIDPSKLMPIDTETTPEQTEALAKTLRDKDTPPPLAQ